jgi:hypothetical protein
MEVMLMKKRMLVLVLSVLTLFSVVGFDPGIKAEGLQPPVAPSSDTAAAVTTTGFSDIKGHWAESSIGSAINQGIVSGYPDGLFHPEDKVTRAELVTMTVKAMKLSVDSSGQPAHWFDPFVVSAKSSGIYKDGDFSSTDWNKAMTRMEMIHVAVRAIGETGKDDYEVMYIATKKGLISGTGNGNLDPEGTTTRAQAVTVIQKIQKARNGETLPVDEQAVASAEKAMKTPKDAWGRAIRTDNLPSNYKDYPYILQDIPNDMYELPRSPVAAATSRSKTAATLFATIPEFNKSNIDIWMNHVKNYYKNILNVDYKTISTNWSTELLVETIHADNLPLDEMNDYVDWVKNNNIQIEGSLVPEPSMIYYSGYGTYYVRSKFSFIIKNSKTLDRVIFDHIYDPAYFELKVGVWYEGYADVQIGTNVGGDWGTTLKIVDVTSIFSKPATLREK